MKIDGKYRRHSSVFAPGYTADLEKAVRVPLEQCTVRDGVVQLQYGAISADYTILQQAVLSQKGWCAGSMGRTGGCHHWRAV